MHKDRQEFLNTSLFSLAHLSLSPLFLSSPSSLCLFPFLCITHHTGGTVVRNITFRDCYMHKTVKGIYMKFRRDGGEISNILYENIVMDAPQQDAIWIGPAQQSDSVELCAAHPCSICWPTVPGSVCHAPIAPYIDITFRYVHVAVTSMYMHIVPLAHQPMFLPFEYP